VEFTLIPEPDSMRSRGGCSAELSLKMTVFVSKLTVFVFMSVARARAERLRSQTLHRESRGPG
jgi:hypothetical protein